MSVDISEYGITDRSVPGSVGVPVTLALAAAQARTRPAVPPALLLKLTTLCMWPWLLLVICQVRCKGQLHSLDAPSTPALALQLWPTPSWP